jgi:hypothetical protein
MTEPEKKIIVDEDWKAQVQAEKEQLGRQAAAEPPPSSVPPKGPMPPASLSVLATSLGTQALVALGLVPDPPSGKPQADLEQAQYLIDMLAMLQAKTEGHRTPEETGVLDHLLHELRMGYVAVHEHAAAKPAPAQTD